MFVLSEVRLEAHLEFFRILLEELGEIDQKDADVFRIDFDAIFAHPAQEKRWLSVPFLCKKSTLPLNGSIVVDCDQFGGARTISSPE